MPFLDHEPKPKDFQSGPHSSSDKFDMSKVYTNDSIAPNPEDEIQRKAQSLNGKGD